MDRLPNGAESQWSAPEKPRQITRPRADFLRAAERPLNELTIRDLIIELGKVEDAQAHRADADRSNSSERYMTRREMLIVAELHRRRSLAPTPSLPGDEAADALR